MKPSTKTIFSWLTNETLQKQLQEFKETNPNYLFNETTIQEALDFYDYSKELLINAINQEIFDKQIPYTRRASIHNHLKNITTQLSQFSKYKFNANNVNAKALAQAVITGIQNLTDTVEICRLEERIKGLAAYNSEKRSLIKVRKEYEKILAEIENVKTINSEIKSIYNNSKTIADKISKHVNDINTEKPIAQKALNEIDVILGQIRTNNQEVEDKKVNIIAFHNNTQKISEEVSNLQKELLRILDKEKEINSLISQAEKALNLKLAEGISAAFSSHYNNLNKKSVLIGWLVGAGIFVIAAILLTIWIIVANDNSQIGAIIGRIVAVTISIAGATFCANRYVSQKNLIEDYAYKSVLAKSIVVFTDEIKKRDDKKVAEYLTTVLSEIHRDPLRMREKKEEKNTVNSTDLLNKLLEYLTKDK